MHTHDQRTVHEFNLFRMAVRLRGCAPACQFFKIEPQQVFFECFKFTDNITPGIHCQGPSFKNKFSLSTYLVHDYYRQIVFDSTGGKHLVLAFHPVVGEWRGRDVNDQVRI